MARITSFSESTVSDAQSLLSQAGRYTDQRISIIKVVKDVLSTHVEVPERAVVGKEANRQVVRIVKINCIKL